MAKEKKSKKSVDEARIVRFLSDQDGPYPEPKLVEALFGIKMNDEELPVSEKDLDQVQQIRDMLSNLVASKKIYASMLEDPNTHEETLNYSSKGFYETP